MERETEPMAEAPTRGNLADAEVGEAVARPVERWFSFERCEPGMPEQFEHQPSGKPARPEGRIPHGVESAPKTDERSSMEPENLFDASRPRRDGMIEATDDRGKEGRSLRSSPRTGKPSTWRRKAVDTECRQGVD
jgi:hypothetical protein